MPRLYQFTSKNGTIFAFGDSICEAIHKYEKMLGYIPGSYKYLCEYDRGYMIQHADLITYVQAVEVL